MSDKTVDEIEQEIARFGRAAIGTYQAWRRTHPTATRVPRKVWKQIDQQARTERWQAKIRVRQQLRQAGETRTMDRSALYSQLDRELAMHRNFAVSWYQNPAHSPEQRSYRQWELVRDRERIERLITGSGLLSKEERGHAVKALQAAHFAYQPGVKQISARPNSVLKGIEALKARAAERVSRIRLGITERGRTGRRPQPDRPAQPKPMFEQMADLRHLIAERQEMQINQEILTQRLRARGASIDSFAPDSAAMADGHRKNLAGLDREIQDRIIGSGMGFDDWLNVQFQLREPQTPEQQATRRWLERQSDWELANRYRVKSWDRHLSRVTGSDSLRRWDHDFPEEADQLRREFLNPPAGWEPVAMDDPERFTVLIDWADNAGKAQVRSFGAAQNGYDWAQRKMAWVAEPHTPVSITMWDRAIPLDANNRIRGFAVDSMQGLYAHLDPELDSRYAYFRDLMMRNARDRSIPPELSTPGLEDFNKDRPSSWTSVRANNIDPDFDKIHSVGESGRVWTMVDAEYFGHRQMNREQLEAQFAQVQRNVLGDVHEEWGLGWSQEIEQLRYQLDHSQVLTSEERARAREILAITETEAKLGQAPDRNLWKAVTDQAEFDRWSRLDSPSSPGIPETPEPPQPDPQPGLIGRTRAVQAEARNGRYGAGAAAVEEQWVARNLQNPDQAPHLDPVEAGKAAMGRMRRSSARATAEGFAQQAREDNARAARAQGVPVPESPEFGEFDPPFDPTPPGEPEFVPSEPRNASQAPNLADGGGTHIDGQTFVADNIGGRGNSGSVGPGATIPDHDWGSTPPGVGGRASASASNGGTSATSAGNVYISRDSRVFAGNVGGVGNNVHVKLPDGQPDTPPAPETPDSPLDDATELPEPPDTPEAPEPPDMPEGADAPETPEVPDAPDTPSGPPDMEWGGFDR